MITLIAKLVPKRAQTVSMLWSRPKQEAIVRKAGAEENIEASKVTSNIGKLGFKYIK
jgi:hypothetical protein